MTETLITANVPEWITAFMGFLAMVTGLGVIAFLWKSLKPLVDERIDFKTVETNKRLDRLENKSDRQDEGIAENRKSIDRIKELEHKQDLSINQLVSERIHIFTSNTIYPTNVITLISQQCSIQSKVFWIDAKLSIGIFCVEESFLGWTPNVDTLIY